MKKITVSLIAIMFAMPSFADNEPSYDINAGANSADCVSDTLHATSGNVNLNANWDPNTVNITYYSDNSEFTTGSCVYDQSLLIPQTEPTKTGYTFGGWKVRIQQTLDLVALIGNGESENIAYVNNNSQFRENGAAHGQSYYGINGNNTWAVDYGSNGMLVGQARCSTQPGVFDFNWGTNELNQPITTASSLTDETGQTGAKYCYCNVTGYTPASGTLQSVSSSWVYLTEDGSSCASDCAYFCAYNMHGDDANYLAFRAALFGAVQ